MAKRKGNICRATKSSRRSLNKCIRKFGKDSVKCRSMKRRTC